MCRLGNMLWRIGDILDFDAQLDWTLKAGFEGVGFHACVGIPGQWRGVSPADCTGERRNDLKHRLRDFSFAEIHAPFAVELQTDSLEEGMAALAPVLQLAADLEVDVVTVHARMEEMTTKSIRANWYRKMSELEKQAVRAETTIALEIVDGFDIVKDWNLEHIGVTLDIGHMYQNAQSRVLASFGGIAYLIDYLGCSLFHLHVHDTDGTTDHCEIGTGIVDFPGAVAALRAIGYSRGMTLEMNPKRCSPDGIVRSVTYLQAVLAGANGQ